MTYRTTTRLSRAPQLRTVRQRTAIARNPVAFVALGPPSSVASATARAAARMRRARQGRAGKKKRTKRGKKRTKRGKKKTKRSRR